MPKQTALDTINRLIVEDRENGVTRRRIGGTLSTIDRLIQEEDE